jgi:hypothetical protein
LKPERWGSPLVEEKCQRKRFVARDKMIILGLHWPDRRKWGKEKKGTAMAKKGFRDWKSVEKRKRTKEIEEKERRKRMMRNKRKQV